MPIRRRTSLLVLVVMLAGAALAGAQSDAGLKLATTTSTDNSGLLDWLLPVFEEETGIEVHVLAVGSGKALELGRNGDVDVILVHAPEAEKAFVAGGFGIERRPVMKNDFLIVGPPLDPCGLREATDLASALGLLAGCATPFVSRGDDSGTHRKELELWSAVGVQPPGEDVYLEIGQGMEATLRMAHEKGAYTVTDRGTFLALRATLELESVFEGDSRLDNPYAVIAVNPRRHPHVRAEAAQLLVAWLGSATAQAKIAEFRVGSEILFHPAAVPGE